MENSCERIETRKQEFLTEFNELNTALNEMYDTILLKKRNAYRNNSIVQTIEDKLRRLEMKRIELINKYRDEYSIYEAIKAAETTHDYVVNDLRNYSEKKPLLPLNLYPKFPATRPRRSSFSNFVSKIPKISNPLTRRKSFGGKHKNKTRKH
jgi:predicted nuclease with TOPRIM domain